MTCKFKKKHSASSKVYEKFRGERSGISDCYLLNQSLRYISLLYEAVSHWFLVENDSY